MMIYVVLKHQLQKLLKMRHFLFNRIVLLFCLSGVKMYFYYGKMKKRKGRGCIFTGGNSAINVDSMCFQHCVPAEIILNALHAFPVPYQCS